MYIHIARQCLIWTAILLPRKFFSWSQRDDGVSSKKNLFEPKQTKIRSVSVVFRFVSWNQKQKKSVCFGLFWCFEFISKQPKQTELFLNKPKQTETTLNFLKNTKICSMSNCFGCSSVCFGSIETPKLSVSEQKRNNRNKRFVSDSAETSFCSSFGCFELKLVSKDTLWGKSRGYLFTVLVLSGIPLQRPNANTHTELEFLNNLWELGTE